MRTNGRVTANIRSIVLSFFFILVSAFSYFFITKVSAANTTPVIGSAVSMNTNNPIFFTSATYGANVVIGDPDSENSNIRTISGYAWSQDIGWIKFTAGESTGVFVNYTTGAVTGSAYVINTGKLLDFTNYNSNVVVNTETGIFTGYVWSEDIGWIDFGTDDVYVKDSLAPNNVDINTVNGYSTSEQTKGITSSTSVFYNYTAPYFEWDKPSDPSTESHGYASSGVNGYYVYWGPSSTAIPSSSGTFQTTNYFTASVSVDQTYYLRMQAVDAHGNVYTNADASTYTFFEYKADLTLPANVKYIITPSSTFSSIGEMFFNWPSAAGVTSTDENGIIGWQYSLNSPDHWTGTSTSERFGFDYFPIEDEVYSYYLTEERDGEASIEGNNIVYFRAIDSAGNFSSYVTGVIGFGGLAPQFPAESTVVVNPLTSVSNSFALSWPEAVAREGRTVSKYYYMVNTEPPATYSTLTSNSSLYVPVDENYISASTLRGAIKGSNTVYVVAVDDQNGYSQSYEIHGTFTLNSTVPDPVQDLSIADTSVKESSLWKASLTWEVPEYKGNGTLTYIIQRSTNGTSWTTVGETEGLSYTDILPTSNYYYYQVGVSDSSDDSQENPTLSLVIGTKVQGKYVQPAGLVSGPTISALGTRYAEISWVTDRVSDTKIAFGISSGEYFEEEVYNSDQKTEHSIKLNNLQPETAYYYVIKWTDEDGNTGTAMENTFMTEPAPKVLTSKVDRVGLDYAMISFEVSGATKASVLYGGSLAYTGLKEVNTSTSRSTYSVIIEGLQDGATYNYRIRLTDEEGYIYDSIENHIFSTPPRPEISEVRIQEVKDVASPTVLFSWYSNAEVNSIVTYRENVAGSADVNKIEMEYISGLHEMEISGLEPQTEYVAHVEGVDQLGNKAISEDIVFTTQTDTRPPKISSVKIEQDLLSRTIQTEKSRSAQLIVTWDTDEPSTSKVEYGEGGAGVYTSSSKVDQSLSTKHLVIVSGLTPSKVYSLKIVSTDMSGNTEEYGPLVSITSKSNSTVLETVLGTIADIFNVF